MRGQAQRTELAREARAAEALALEHTPEGRQSTALHTFGPTSRIIRRTRARRA